MSKTRFRDGGVLEDGRLTIGDSTYVGTMPDEARSDERGMHLRWGSRWYSDIEAVVADGLMTPAPLPLHEVLLSHATLAEENEKKLEELVAWMRTRSGVAFIDSLLEQYDEKGWLSDKQVDTALRIQRGEDRPSWDARAKAETRTETRSEHAREHITATPKLMPGIYQSVSGKLLVVSSLGTAFQTEPPSEYGTALEWDELSGVPRGSTTDVARLSIDNILGFGMLHGACLVCGVHLPDDNDIGIHEACYSQLDRNYSYKDKGEL